MRQYYRVLLDGFEIYNPADRERILINPIVKPSIESAGSFEFTIDSSHQDYNDIIPYGSTIEVLEDGDSIFYGRPTPPKINIYGQKTYHCEGAIAFLNDVVIAPLSKYIEDFTSNTSGSEGEGFTSGEDDDFHGDVDPEETGRTRRTINLNSYLSYVFDKYNYYQAKADRKLVLSGPMTTDATILYNSDYKTCLEIIRDEILAKTPCYMVANRINNSTVVNFTSSFPQGDQPVTAGANLLDFIGEMQEFYTGVIAKGAALNNDYQSEEAVALKEPIMLDSEIVNTYGTIIAYKYFPECFTEEALKLKCRQFLQEQQFGSMRFEVSATDLHLTNTAYNAIKIGTTIQFSSPAHNLTANLVVSGMEIHLDTGEKKLTIGEKQHNTFTQTWITQVQKKKPEETSESNDIIVEDVPREGSYNPISSGGVYDALQGYTPTPTPTPGDGWIHQIDGVEQETGTVNFVTVSEP